MTTTRRTNYCKSDTKLMSTVKVQTPSADDIRNEITKRREVEIRFNHPDSCVRKRCIDEYKEYKLDEIITKINVRIRKTAKQNYYDEITIRREDLGFLPGFFTVGDHRIHTSDQDNENYRDFMIHSVATHYKKHGYHVVIFNSHTYVMKIDWSA